jgi:hypothetical protein
MAEIHPYDNCGDPCPFSEIPVGTYFRLYKTGNLHYTYKKTSATKFHHESMPNTQHEISSADRMVIPLSNIFNTVPFSEIRVGERFRFNEHDKVSFEKISTDWWADQQGYAYSTKPDVRVVRDNPPRKGTMKIEIELTDNEAEYIRKLKPDFITGTQKTITMKLQEQVKPKIIGVGFCPNDGSPVLEMVYTETAGWIMIDNYNSYLQRQHPNGFDGYAWPDPPK